jgi:RimJ/RimL family protein N-acetyltransferase
MNVRIETLRLILRGWRGDDVEAWIQTNSDPRITEFFAKSYTREQSAASAAAHREQLATNGYGWWVIEAKNVLPFAGVAVLQPVPFEAHFTPAWEVGWRLAHSAWGHGYATEAAAALLRLGFEKFGCDEIVAFTTQANLRSQRVMQRLGMTRNSADDFDHPRIEPGHPLRRHVLYRIMRSSPPAL